MLLSGLTHAAGYYIQHSTPSPHASGSQTPKDPNAPPPPPPRALLLLSHPKTHATLSRAYAISGQAVRVSQKTVGVVESMIRRAVGGQDKPKTSSASLRPARPTPAASAPAVPVSSASSSSADVPPPPYSGPSTSQEALDGKPPLPPRRGPPPPLPPRSRSKSPAPPGTPQPPSQAPASSTAPLPPPRPLKTHEKLLLSANLVLATVDDSARRMLDVGSQQLTAVMGHNYGASAGRTTELATHTARNVTLVYIDMQGLARRALIKKAGKEWVKDQQGAAQMDGVVVLHPRPRSRRWPIEGMVRPS